MVNLHLVVGYVMTVIIISYHLGLISKTFLQTYLDKILPWQDLILAGSCQDLVTKVSMKSEL